MTLPALSIRRPARVASRQTPASRNWILTGLPCLRRFAAIRSPPSVSQLRNEIPTDDAAHSVLSFGAAPAGPADARAGTGGKRTNTARATKAAGRARVGAGLFGAGILSGAGALFMLHTPAYRYQNKRFVSRFSGNWASWGRTKIIYLYSIDW